MRKVKIVLLTAMLMVLLALPASSQNLQPIEITGTLSGVFSCSGFCNGRFEASHAVIVGRGYEVVNLQLAGWDFRFRSSDHHLTRASIRFIDKKYNEFTGLLTFKVVGFFHDKNYDDAYNWTVDYTVVAIPPM